MISKNFPGWGTLVNSYKGYFNQKDQGEQENIEAMYI